MNGCIKQSIFEWPAEYSLSLNLLVRRKFKDFQYSVAIATKFRKALSNSQSFDPFGSRLSEKYFCFIALTTVVCINGGTGPKISK